MLIQNVCHKSVLHLQEIVLLLFSGNNESHTAPCLFSSVFFDLCPATALSHQSLTSSNRPGNRLFPRVIIITSVLFGLSKAAY